MLSRRDQQLQSGEQEARTRGAQAPEAPTPQPSGADATERKLEALGAMLASLAELVAAMTGRLEALERAHHPVADDPGGGR